MIFAGIWEVSFRNTIIYYNEKGITKKDVSIYSNSNSVPLPKRISVVFMKF